MAASTTPRPTTADSAARAIEGALAACLPPLPLGVAFSGGADSTALLAACARRWPGQVRALHVHHGLQAAADDFERQCRASCEALGVPLAVLRVDARHRRGESPEDAARRARYAALAEAARAQGLAAIWLAQHADDQVETLLLALSRGAGLPGLAAMPTCFERDGVRFERPLLGVPGAALRQWLQASGLSWIEDPSNAHEGYTRNRIRRQLMPALEAAFPGFRETFARSARHAAQASSLLADMAAQDLAAMDGEPRIAPLQTLSRERQANVLRHWLRTHHAVAPSAAQLEELLDQVQACRTRGHRIELRAAAGLVRRQQDRLTYTPTV